MATLSKLEKLEKLKIIQESNKQSATYTVKVGELTFTLKRVGTLKSDPKFQALMYKYAFQLDQIQKFINEEKDSEDSDFNYEKTTTAIIMLEETLQPIVEASIFKIDGVKGKHLISEERHCNLNEEELSLLDEDFDCDDKATIDMFIANSMNEKIIAVIINAVVSDMHKTNLKKKN